MDFQRSYLEKQYARMLSSRLSQFVVKSEHPFVANFRCPICGDSERNKFKKRGFILEGNNGLKFMCHNCGESMSFASYMKRYDNDLFRQYYVELLKLRAGGDEQFGGTAGDIPDERPAQVDKSTTDYQNGLVRLDQISPDADVRRYVESRKIPESKIQRIYYAERFYQYINSHIENKFSHDLESKYDHPRLILPMADAEGKWFGVIARAVDSKQQLRYITIKFDPKAKKVYGLNYLDRSQFCFVLEGALDSLFIPNALALGGMDGSVEGVFTDHSQYAIALDNQPRNRDVISRYDKYLSQGAQVVIWPDYIKSKDINQMILDGIPADRILDTMKSRVFKGLIGQIELKKWKRA